MPTPETPAANKTSEAVATILQRQQAGEDNPFGTVSYNDVLGIIARSQRMEEALRSEPCHCTHEDDLCHACTVGQLALAYDPLSQ